MCWGNNDDYYCSTTTCVPERLLTPRSGYHIVSLSTWTRQQVLVPHSDRLRSTAVGHHYHLRVGRVLRAGSVCKQPLAAANQVGSSSSSPLIYMSNDRLSER